MHGFFAKYIRMSHKNEALRFSGNCGKVLCMPLKKGNLGILTVFSLIVEVNWDK